ncbi:hypothetical protein [Flavonifractor sp.]|uniref:hypothetical protein n=1 Tax=Flavonifractor sp. TaxID=2049025 RepID=UPI0025BD3552|nr:hypothetical protein [Flavonifractor sp.]
MTEQDAAAIRRKTARLLAAVLLGLALLAFGCFWFWCSLFGWPAALRHGNPNLSPQAAAEQLESGGLARLEAGAYYEVSEGSGLGALLQADSWTPAESFRPEGAELALRFGERYELYLCADGRAAFYDGYAPGDIRLWSCYSLPAEAVANLVSTLPERAVSTQEPYGTFTY